MNGGQHSKSGLPCVRLLHQPCKPNGCFAAHTLAPVPIIEIHDDRRLLSKDDGSIPDGALEVWIVG